MAQTTAEPIFGQWSAAHSQLSVEYASWVFEEIRAAVCKNRSQHSSDGFEIGGLLFGTRQNNSIRILAWRPISCEHAEGPALHLSSDDRRDLLRLLLASKQDPELATFQPLGWFVSHPSGDIALNHSDSGIFKDFFSEPWQVTLVVIPSSDGAIRGGFFVRQADGTLHSESTYPEFTIQPSTHAHTPRRNRQSPATLRKLFGGAPLAWTVAGVLAVLLAIVWLKPKPAPQQAPVSGFSLHIQQSGPQLQILWDPAARAIRDAMNAVLDVQDDARPSHIQLDATQLQLGKMNWPRHGDSVEARMTVKAESGSSVTESASFTLTTVSLPAAAPGPDALAPEVRRLNSELQKERARSDKLQNMVKILENRIEVDSARKPKEPQQP